MIIRYSPIGFVKSDVHELLRPEEIRGRKSIIVLNSKYKNALKEIAAGQYLIVIYHLHKVDSQRESFFPEWIKRRVPNRPNPIAITLVKVLDVCESDLTVIGLDAIDGSPILDIKPYKPIFDNPPVEPSEINKTSRRSIILLTGGPGGGKSTLIEDLRNDPELKRNFITLPEAIQYSRIVNIPPNEKLFQRVIVNIQISLEDSLDKSLEENDSRPIICHRGSLDPLAFWLKKGWAEKEFFQFIGMSKEEHYKRYSLVIHLVTSADGVPSQYTRWPVAHRPESVDEAIQLDHYLEKIWSGHPHYFKIDNINRTWEAKSQKAKEIIINYLNKIKRD